MSSFDSSGIQSDGVRETIVSGKDQSLQAPKTLDFKTVMDGLGMMGSVGANAFGKGTAAMAINALTGSASNTFSGSTAMRSMSAGGAAGMPPPPPPPPSGMSSFGGSSSSSMGSFNPTGGSDPYSGQIDAMFNNNMMFLALQTRVQNASQQIQTMSNISKTENETLLVPIRNLK